MRTGILIASGVMNLLAAVLNYSFNAPPVIVWVNLLFCLLAAICLVKDRNKVIKLKRKTLETASN